MRHPERHSRTPALNHGIILPGGARNPLTCAAGFNAMTDPNVKPVHVGEDIAVVPKNPLASTSVWGLIVVVVNLVIQKLVKSGKVPAEVADVLGNATLETIVYLIGVGLAFYGRCQATRPLGIGGPMQKTVK